MALEACGFISLVTSVSFIIFWLMKDASRPKPTGDLPTDIVNTFLSCIIIAPVIVGLFLPFAITGGVAMLKLAASRGLMRPVQLALDVVGAISIGAHLFIFRT